MEMTVSLAQFRVTAGDPADNLRRAETLVAEAARRGSGLVCFPEMWTTGFQWSANARLAAEHEAVNAAIGALAAKYRLWIHGSTLAVAGPGKVANTAVLFDADGGRAGAYRKTHLFTPMEEHLHVTAGDALALVETPWGRAGLAICYDLRFPELFRAYALRGADFVLCPAAFPLARRAHWQILTRARAIENQMFVLATNQVGAEDLDPGGPTTYAGSSVVLDPCGEALAEASATDETLLTVTLDPALTAATREKWDVLRDRRPELYARDG